jgi:hypothetical protein
VLTCAVDDGLGAGVVAGSVGLDVGVTPPLAVGVGLPPSTGSGVPAVADGAATGVPATDDFGLPARAGAPAGRSRP